MDDVELEKITKDPDGDTRREECTVWVDDTTLAWCRVMPEETDEGEKEFATEEEAVKAAEAMIAQLKAEGFVPEVEVKDEPRPPDPPSEAKEGAVKPSWMGALPPALLRQHKKLRNLAKKKGLAHRFPEIEALMRPVMDLRLKKAKKADLERVVSRVGGEPDLPAEVAWPGRNSAPFTFVGQIAISKEIKELDLEGVLPADGLLSFFAQLDPDASEYGDQCVVLYSAKTEGLVRTAPPSPACVIKKAGLLTPKPRLAVPPSEALVVEELHLSGDEADEYHDEMFGQIPEGRHHMLLGWPNATSYYDIEGKRFLAQFDSDHRIDFEMGDYDTLRFYFDGDVVDAATVKTAVCTLSVA